MRTFFTAIKSVAAAYGTTWNICHEAVKATADPVLAAEPDAVVVLGIDETRRGKAKWETCPDTGGRRWGDRWDTGLVDITGAGGLLVQVNGRAARPVIDWLAERDALEDAERELQRNHRDDHRSPGLHYPPIRSPSPARSDRRRGWCRNARDW